MTKIEDIIGKIKDPDKQPEGLADLSAYVKELEDSVSKLTNAEAESAKRIKTLQDSNTNLSAALILSQTGKPTKEEEEDERTDYEKLIDYTNMEEKNDAN